ncbi:MAG: hypothetical protein HY922_12515 [Elusimicrobia bacterium]|nr:hypothetical protein [Elusimicrobiota bacterium]
MNPNAIRRLLRETRLVRAPKRLLSAFGATRIEYHLVSPVEDLPDKTRLREGRVVSDRPKILTAQALRERFEGFGEEARDFSDWLCREYRDVLRALEYRFKNEGLRTRVLGVEPGRTARRIQEDLDERGVAEAAVILCPDTAWSLAVMKFTLDEASRSFPTHLREIESRGLFDADHGVSRGRRAEIERLFASAGRDPEARQALGRKLQEYGLFSEYEDRFLSFF